MCKNILFIPISQPSTHTQIYTRATTYTHRKSISKFAIYFYSGFDLLLELCFYSGWNIKKDSSVVFFRTCLNFSFSKFPWFSYFHKRKYWKWRVWPLLVKISYLLSKWTDWNDLKYVLSVGYIKGFLNVDITAYSECCRHWWLDANS